MLADRIKELRVKNGLTQKDLADKLSVTAQAVSRWENGDVEPSVSTIGMMANIFGVTVDAIVNDNPIVEAPATEQPVVPTEAIPQYKPVLAVCEKCNKPIYEGNEIFRISHTTRTGAHHHHTHTTSTVLCKSCNDKRLEEVKKRAELDRQITIEEGRKRRVKSIVWGIIISLIVGLIFIGSALSYEPSEPNPILEALEIEEYTMSKSGFLTFSIIITVLTFPFVSCLFLKNNFIENMVLTVASWGFVKWPGLIFSLDLDGIVWLITVKIAFAILGFIIGAIVFIFAALLGMAMSVFVYPFALVKNIKHPDEFERI